MEKSIYFGINLQLFAEGATAAGTEGGNNGNAAANAEIAAPQNETGEKNDAPKVMYGKLGIPSEEKSAPAAEAQKNKETRTEMPNTETLDRKSAFEALIKGEYKDLYDERVQDTVQKRLRGSKETVERYDALKPTLDMLARKYGVKADDVEALNKAIADDDAFYEQEAMEKGVSVEQLKAFRKTERENSELKRQLSERNAREGAEKQYAEWMRQGEETKKIYPSFDLREELKNQRFVDLLRANIDTRTAFEVIHRDEIIPAAMQYAAKEAEKQVARSVAANNARPIENGAGSRSSVVVKSDVSKLTDADIDEVIRIVKGGGRVGF